MLASSSRSETSPAPLVLGRTLGTFRALHSVASGGMATVFAAEKRGPGGYVQRVALKVPHPHLWSLQARRAEFAEEARLGCYVNHPNVCGVVDFGETDGIPYLALEYVRGQTFAAFQRSRYAHAGMTSQRALALALHVLARACEGLEAIHTASDDAGRALGIVHCDVCPENLMVGYNGSVRVIDLGVAVALGTRSEAESLPWRGRCAYMAPERIAGQPIDRRADVWSLGVMLCEVLRAQNPFARATTLETILAIRRDACISWPTHVPLELRAIVERALSRSPEQRQGSARELGHELTRFLMASSGAELSSELGRHMRRAFEQESSGRYVTSEPLDARSDPALAHAAPLATARPGRAGRLLALGCALDAAGYRRLSAVAGLTFALTLTSVCYFAAERSAPNVVGHGLRAPLPARTHPRAASRAGSPSTAPSRPASSLARSQTATGAAKAPGATSRRWLPVRSAKLQASARESTVVPEHGVVMLSSALGWADIYEGSKRLGTTPLRVQLSSGLHRLTVRPYGAGPTRIMTVALRPAQTLKLDIALQW